MLIAAGSYERFLWGWRVDQEHGQLLPIFSYLAHLGAIKSIAMSGSVMATGGSDDMIKIYDLNSQRDMGTLMAHKGSVNCLAFYATTSSSSSPCETLEHPKNLLSGSDDGTVCIWKAGSWVLFKTMRGHRRGVNDISIHPSGRLALSVGSDLHLNMYSLLKGRRTFTTKLQSEGFLIKFSPLTGDCYSVASQEVVTVHDSEDGRSLHTFPHSKRVLCLAQDESPQRDRTLFTGAEDFTVRAWDTISGKLAFSIPKAHASRIRGVEVLGSGGAFGSDDATYFIASASSDGTLRIWDSRMVKDTHTHDSNPIPLMEAETKARLTCLTGSSFKGKRWN